MWNSPSKIYNDPSCTFPDDSSFHLTPFFDGWMQCKVTISPSRRTSLQSSGRPRETRTPEMIACKDNLITENTHLGTDELSLAREGRRRSMSHNAVFRILLEDIHLRAIISNWVPDILSEKDKNTGNGSAGTWLSCLISIGSSFWVLKCLCRMKPGWNGTRRCEEKFGCLRRVGKNLSYTSSQAHDQEDHGVGGIYMPSQEILTVYTTSRCYCR